MLRQACVRCSFVVGIFSGLTSEQERCETRVGCKPLAKDVQLKGCFSCAQLLQGFVLGQCPGKGLV